MKQNFIEVKDELLKQVLPEFLDAEYIREPGYLVYRSDRNSFRYYLQVEEVKQENEQITQHKTFIAPSVTSVISNAAPTDYGLLAWYAKNGMEYCQDFLEHSGNYGTFIHACYKDIIKGKPFTLQDDLLKAEMKFFYEENNFDFYGGWRWYIREGRDIKKDLFGFVRFLKDYDVKPIAVEMTVFNKDAGYAGTLDLACILTIKGERIPAIVDFKTGYNEYSSHAIQLEGLKQAWNIEYPDLQINRVFNLYSKDFRMPLSSRVTPYTFRENTENKSLFLWGHYISIFHQQHPEDELNYSDFNPIQVGFDLPIPADFMAEKSLFSDVLEGIKRMQEDAF